MTADEREKNAVNAEIDATIERKSQQDEGEADGADEDIELTEHMRGSSFATLDMVARGRIARFEQVGAGAGRTRVRTHTNPCTDRAAPVPEV